jgi:hypothetical protein
MTPDEFVQFLDGFFSFNSTLNELNKEQTKRIKDKLNTVFIKKTPVLSNYNTSASETAFQKINFPIQHITC